MNQQEIVRIGAVLALTFCAGGAAHADPVAPAPSSVRTLPPQVAGWQAVTDFARHYPGKNLTIDQNKVRFSIAGQFELKYVSPYGNGQLFRIVKTNTPVGQSDRLICPSKMSYLAITPNKIAVLHEPILSFIAFDGRTEPIWKNLRTDANFDYCGQFSYGAPLLGRP